MKNDENVFYYSGNAKAKWKMSQIYSLDFSKQKQNKLLSTKCRNSKLLFNFDSVIWNQKEEEEKKKPYKLLYINNNNNSKNI